jgi:hypothetical protein
MLRANHVLADIGPSDKTIPTGFESFRQFVTWKLVWDDKAKKHRKVPFGRSGKAIGWKDAGEFMTGAEAVAACRQRRHMGIGFFFTPDDDFWFIDLDNAWNGSAWSPLALAIFAMFPGAAFEVSQSGNGAHFFGRGAASIAADHLNKVPGIEFYTAKRFAALTGTSKAGNAAVDFSAVLPVFVRQYGLESAPKPVPALPSAPIAPAPVLPTIKPADFIALSDDEIIATASAARGSIAVQFGDKAHFREMWNGDRAALAKHFPARDKRADGEAFDWSRADAALLAHLAYWTCGDRGWMDRLFRRSALMRPEWNNASKQSHTLDFAIGRANGQYYRGAPPLPATAASRIDATVAAANASVGSGGYLTTREQEKLFAGCVYIIDLHMVLMPDGRLLPPPNFQSAFGGYEFQMQTDGGRPVRNAFEAFTANRMMQFPKVADICFRPSEAPGAIIGDAVNIWRPLVIDEAPGDVALFLDHLGKLLPDQRDRKILLTYMQALVQYPGVKFQWAPVIQGVEGNGKTFLIQAMVHAVSERYAHRPKASQLTEKFNGWMIGKLFIGVEEIKIPDHRREMIEDLKEWITNDRIEIRHVGGRKAMSENYANWMLTTNHKDAVPVNRNQRRFSILFTAQQSVADIHRDGMTPEYFTRLYQWFKSGGGKQAIAHYLRHSQIDPEFDPAGACQRAPLTSSTVEAFSVSLGRIEQEIMEAIAEGRAGFRGGWISSIAVDHLLREKSLSGIGPNKKSEILTALGYRRECRSSCIIIEEDRKQPWLYRKDDLPAEPFSAASTGNFKAWQGYK